MIILSGFQAEGSTAGQLQARTQADPMRQTLTWELCGNAGKERIHFPMELLTATMPSQGGDLEKETHPERRDGENQSPHAIYHSVMPEVRFTPVLSRSPANKLSPLFLLRTI